MIQAASASMKVSAGVPADANWPGDRVRFVTTPRCGATTCGPARSSWAFSSCASAAIRAGLSWPPGPSWGDAVAEAEEVLGLFVGAEFMRADQHHAVRGLQLGHRPADGAVAGGLVHGIDGQRDVALLALERRVPVFRRVLAKVAQDVGAGRHPLLEGQRKGLQRRLGDAQRLEPLMTEGDAGPEVEIVVEALGRRDVGGEPRDQVAAAVGVVDMQHRMDADMGFGSVAQDQRLDVIQLQPHFLAPEAVADCGDKAHVSNPPARVSPARRSAFQRLAGGFIDILVGVHGVEEILQRVIHALIAAHVHDRDLRVGDEPAGASIWCSAMKSLTLGLSMPGQPSTFWNSRSISSGI
ncbi:hypothetical protein [Paracoccus sphaerophysae]|uniref:hypothetical protein n=1 Tax=Paracoccus sphaerophysae TaxID=690417 RepID=UPI0023526B01|nr:hypothetical protein [Paracoccus sphaerophysae]